MMKSLKYYVILFFTLLSCNGSHGQLTSDKEFVASNLLLKDLDTLRHWITKAHGDPYRFTTKEKLNKQFEIAKQKILDRKSITGNEFAGIIMPVIAELRDGHAQVFLPNLFRINGDVIFPVKFAFVNQKPFVIKNMSTKNIDIGSEIVEIDGQNAERFFKDIIPFLHRDGDIQTVRYRRLQNQAYLTRVLIALGKASNRYTIKVKNKNGDIKSFKVNGLSQKAFNMSTNTRKQKNKPLRYTTIDSLTDTALIDINTFNPGYYEDVSYYKQIDSLFTTIREDNISKIIIDLRNNIGGEDSYVMYLLRYLLDHKFSVNSEITFRQNNYKFLPDGKHWDIAPNCFEKNTQGTYDATENLWEDHCTLGSFEPFENRFKGEVIVLINAFTFSAASDFASMLYYKQRAIFVGEETGGSSIGNVSGYVPTLDLPNSRVKVNLPLISVKSPFFDSKFNTHGVIPNYQIEPTVNSILNNIDNVLMKALSLL